MKISRRLPIALFALVTIQWIACEATTPTLSDRDQASFVGLGDFIASCHVGTPPARMHRHEYWDYGCYCGTGGAGTPVDATDECCKAHDECWAKVKRDTGTGCFWEGYDSNYNDPATGKPTTDCSKWTFAESCSKAKHPDNDKPAEESCCRCDLEAAQCFQRARPTYDPGYQDWSDDGNPGATCGPNRGKSYTCQSGYIGRKTACAEGTKRGNRVIGYWCETTCNKPQTCQTSTAADNAYARCAAAGTVVQACPTTISVEALSEVSVDEPPCTGDECDECPHCTADSCSGNHAPMEEDDIDDGELPDPQLPDAQLPDAGMDAPAITPAITDAIAQ